MGALKKSGAEGPRRLEEESTAETHPKLVTFINSANPHHHLKLIPTECLRAAAGGAAGHAAVTRTVAGHDGAAEAACRGVAEVDQFAQGVGGVTGTSSQVGRGSLIVRR